MSLKAELMFLSKSFHLKQNFSEDIFSNDVTKYQLVSQAQASHVEQLLSRFVL